MCEQSCSCLVGGSMDGRDNVGEGGGGMGGDTGHEGGDEGSEGGEMELWSHSSETILTLLLSDRWMGVVTSTWCCMGLGLDGMNLRKWGDQLSVTVQEFGS